LLWFVLSCPLSYGARVWRYIAVPRNQGNLKSALPHRTGGRLSPPQHHQQHMQQQGAEQKTDHPALLAASVSRFGICQGKRRAHAL
jgi:hypothetical protein